MNTLRRVLCVTAAVFAMACGVEWRQISSVDGQFHIDLPVPSREMFGEVETPYGALILKGYTGDGGRKPQRFFDSITLIAQYADISILTVEEPTRLVDAVIKARLESLKKQRGGKVISEDRLDDGVCQGKEIEVELRFTRVRERVCIVGDRLYDLEVLAPSDKIRGPDANRFFGSFRPL
jgi:hypothetical protein